MTFPCQLRPARRHDGMLITYTPDQLRSLNHDRPPLLVTRKAIFSLSLWRPRRHRCAADTHDYVTVNKRRRARTASVRRASSSLSVGWLNARSLSKKTTAVCETIDDRRLDVLAVTESWHRGSDDLSLRLAAPSDYAAVDAVREADPGHGGIVVFYRKHFSCKPISLPATSTYESLCVQLSDGGESVTLLAIYRPGLTRTSTSFFNEFTSVHESLVLLNGTVVIGGDFNIHMEDVRDADAQRLTSVFDAFDQGRSHVFCFGGTSNDMARL